jgi:hypothetical protein
MRSNIQILLSLLILTFCSLAGAQTRCAPGAVPGSLQCQPDGIGQATPQTVIKYTGHWIKTWGALADGRNGVGAAVVGQESKSDAERAALVSCADRGGIDCTLTITYNDQCVAAANPVGGAVGKAVTAGSLKQAEDYGLRACSQANGGSSCEIVYSSCTERKYVKD